LFVLNQRPGSPEFSRWPPDSREVFHARLSEDCGSKQEGWFMIIQMLKKTVVADQSVAHFCQILCSLSCGLVLLFGIRRLAHLRLSEEQLFLAMIGTLLLAGVFIVLGFQCRAWRRAATSTQITAGEANILRDPKQTGEQPRSQMAKSRVSGRP
jgi:hypothetical protein